MKIPFAAIVTGFALVAAASSALAEPKGQKGKGPATPQVRYFDLSQGIFSDLGSESILKENRQGATLVSAELDVCHVVSPDSNRIDRFVVPLKVEGNRLTGTGVSQEGKRAVSVNLIRRASGGNFTFEGTVTSGSTTAKVQSTDNNEMTEEEIADQYLNEPAIIAAPSDFSTAWPQALHARVGRDGLPALLDALRDQTVRIVYNTLLPSCRVLRSGHYTVQIDVEAERVAAVLAKLKTLPLIEIGFSSNTPNMQRAVRFPSAGFRDAAGKLQREKLSAAVGEAMAKALSATLTSATWDAAMGELTVDMKRPDESIPGLKLAQLITATVVVAPESLTSHQNSILWIESITSKIVDERPAPKLTFSIAQGDENSEGQTSEPDGSDRLPDAVAAALNGQPWDSEAEQWRQ